MIAKSVDQITEEDLQALVDNSVMERKTLEYKQMLPSNSDSDKKRISCGCVFLCQCQRRRLNIWCNLR